MRRARRFLAIAVCLAACAESRTINLSQTLSPDDLHVFVRTDAGQKIVGIELAKPNEDIHRLELGFDETLWVWSLPEGMVVDVHGAGPSEEEWKSLTAVTANAPDDGSCGRCLAPMADGTFISLPGTECEIGRQVPHSVFALEGEGELVPSSPPAGEIDRVRRLARLRSSDACACDLPRLSDTRDVEIRALDGSTIEDIDAIGALFAAKSTSGHVFVVRSEDVLVIDPVTQSRATAAHSPGSPIDAVVLPDDTLLLAIDPIDAAVFEVFDTTGARLSTKRSAFRPRRMRVVGNPQQLLVAGGSASAPGILSCTLPFVSIEDCEQKLVPELVADAFNDVTRIEDGTIVALAHFSPLYLASFDLQGGVSVFTAEGSLRGEDEYGRSYETTWVYSMGSLGNRIFLGGASEPLVFSALVENGSLVAPPTVSYQSPWSSLAWISGTTNTSTIIRAYSNHKSDNTFFVDFDRDGRPVGASDPMNISSPDPTVIFDRASDISAPDIERAVMTTSDGSVYSAEEPPQKFYGPESMMEARSFAVRNGEPWVFVTRASRDDVANLEASGLAVFSDFEEGEIPLAASFDEVRDRFIVGGYRCDSSGGHPMLFSFSPSGQRSEIELPPKLNLSVNKCNEVAVVQTQPFFDSVGRVLILAEQAKTPYAFLLEDETLVEVELSWDDPETEDVEKRPNDTCGRRFPKDAARFWRSASAKASVAWASGCGATLFRFLPTESWPARRIASFGEDINELTDTTTGREITSIKALCPDHVLGGIRRVTSGVRQGRLFTVTPNPDAPGWRFYDDPLHASAATPRSSIGPPREIIGDGTRLTVLFSTTDSAGSLQVIGSENHPIFEFGVFDAEETRDGDILLGSQGFVGRARRIP